MCLNLNDYLLKTSRYSHRATYMNHIVTTYQKSTIDTQRQEKRITSLPLKKSIKPQGKNLKEEEQRTTKTS